MAEGKFLTSTLAARIQRQERGRIARHVDLDPERFFLLNFFAPPGFGRTEILEQAFRDFSVSSTVSLVKVRDLARQDRPLFAGILHRIVADLALAQEDVILIGGNGEADDQLAEAVVGLTRSVAALGRKILVLVDDYDDAPDEVRWRFESTVLAPLSSCSTLGVVLTSQSQLHFDEIELHTHLESCELESLTREHVVNALGDPFRGLATKLVELTGGVPALLCALVADLEAQGYCEDDLKDQSNLLDKLYTQQIEHFLSREVSPNEKTSETLLILSLLRRFDVPVLHSFLPRLMPDVYDHYSSADYRDLVNRLGALVRWNARSRGYAIHPDIAKALLRYVTLERPRFCHDVPRVAFDVHTELLQQGFKEYYLLEALFYRARLVVQGMNGNGKRSDTDLQAKITAELKKYLERWRPNINAVSLHVSLMRDPDLRAYASLAFLNNLDRSTAWPIQNGVASRLHAAVS